MKEPRYTKISLVECPICKESFGARGFAAHWASHAICDDCAHALSHASVSESNSHASFSEEKTSVSDKREDSVSEISHASVSDKREEQKKVIKKPEHYWELTNHKTKEVLSFTDPAKMHQTIMLSSDSDHMSISGVMSR